MTISLRLIDVGDSMKNALLFALSVGGLSVAQPGLAATLYESAPASAADFELSYPSTSTGFNFLARFTLAAESLVSGFEIVTLSPSASIGDDVTFKLLDNTSLFTLGTQITSLSSFDGSDVYFWTSTRFAPISLAAGTYWIGMSGVGYDLNWSSAAGLSSSEAYPMVGDSFIDFSGDQVADTLPINFAFRVLGEGVTPPIPEPSAWIMMIAGFGLAGATLRRRSIRFQTA